MLHDRSRSIECQAAYNAASLIDRYNSSTYLSLDFPSNMYVANGPRSAKDRPIYNTMLIVGQAANDDHLTQWSINSLSSLVIAEHDDRAAPSPLSAVGIKLQRPITFLFFYWALAFAPALLGCVYLWGWETSRRRGTPEQGSALELGAALLALLTIREVLVSPDLPGLTLLDRVLGLQLVMIVCALTVALVRRPTPHPENPWAAIATGAEPPGRRRRSFPRRSTR